MFHLQSILRLVPAAWRRVRPSQVRPSRSRPSLENLPDRILPSIDLAGPVQQTLSQDLAEPGPDQMRFMEVPKSDDLLSSWESDAFSLSPQQMSDILGGPSRVEQLGTPVVTHGTVGLLGDTFQTLDLQFGPSLTVHLVFGGVGAGSAGGPGSAASAQPPLLGGLVDVNSDGVERRFLMDYGGASRDRPDGPPLSLVPNALQNLGDGKWTRPALGDRPVIGAQEPTETAPLAETTGPSLAPFLAGSPGGKQIADGLAAQAADDVGVNGMAEVAANAPGNPADVLLTVDTVLPDARADLVSLQNADLTIVPTYVVIDAPAAPVAPPGEGERSDLGLTAQVVGLDELPGGVSRAPSSADRLFEQLAWADGGRGVEAWRLAAAGVESGGIEVGDAPHAAARAGPTASPTDAGLALREWLDGLLQEGGKGAAVVSALALEGLMAYVCWRGWRPGPQDTRPK
jgi:hypothetical protein